MLYVLVIISTFIFIHFQLGPQVIISTTFSDGDALAFYF